MALVAVAHVFNGELPKRSQLVDGCVAEHRAANTGTLCAQSLVGQGDGKRFVFLAETDPQGSGRGGGGGGGRALKQVAAVAHGKEEEGGKEMERKWKGNANGDRCYKMFVVKTGLLLGTKRSGV